MVIDIIFAITILYGFYLGFSKGIISTIFSTLSIVFGLMAAFKFAPGATNFLETTFNNNNPLMFLAGFLLSFVVTMIVIRMIAKGLEGILKTANINVLNQLAGGVLLAGFFVVLYSSLLWFGDQARMIDAETKSKSFTYAYIKDFPEQTKEIGVKLKPVFVDFWDQSMDMMDQLERISIEQTEQSSIEDRSDELPQ